MLLTRSMRRKLVFALVLVVIPFMLFTASSLLSVYSYQRTVKDLELAIQRVPRRDELVAAISDLVKPLSAKIPKSDDLPKNRRKAVEAHQERFAMVFNDVRDRVEKYFTRWEQVPESLRPSRGDEFGFLSLTRSINERMILIQSDLRTLKDPELHERTVHEILRYTAEMIDDARRAPDPANRLAERLSLARNDFRYYLSSLIVTAVISGVTFLALLIWAYRLIFVPIRELYEGVKRVAAGEYSSRLDVHTNCELRYLAAAFNDMLDKIRQDQHDKDRAIEERSKQLILSERLVGTGFLASGVAHEINNPLSVIMTAAYGASRDVEDVLDGTDDSARTEILESLELIQSEAERCERITAKLLEFSHGRGQEKNLYDVTAIVNEVANMVGHLSRYQDRHITVNRTDPLHAWISGPEIKQVVLNLVANGLDACAPGGQVWITVQDLPEQVEISVRDDGSGMTPDQMENIFEPFFTTKDVGKGTGLGLSISHRIILNHGGTLDVSSTGKDQGSEFRFRLPKAPVQTAAA